MGAYIDDAGHIGNASSGYTGRIYSDGALILTTRTPSFLNRAVPPGAHRIRVVTEVGAQPDDLFWQRSTAIRTEWGFDSEQPAGQYAVLPMLGIAYQLPGLSSTTTVPAGEYDFGVEFSMPDTVEPRPVVERTVEISWNGGHTWAPAKLTKCGATSCKAHVDNEPGGQASLRVSATDAAGRTVTQQIVNAYAVQQ